MMKSQQKKCNPQLSSRSFKERNPDLNIDEIQNNPNVPDDVKAELCGLNVGGPEHNDDDGCHPANGRMPQAVHMSDTSVEQLILDKYDDMYDSDEDRRQRSRRSKKANDDDEDWYATKRERAGPKKVVRRPKRKSDEGVEKASSVVSKTPRRKRVATKRGSEESSESSASVSSPSEAGSQTSKVATAVNRRTPKKQPPQLPFSLPFDLSKKFEGKIPNRKVAIVTAAMAAATAGATTPSTPASAGAMSPPATGDRTINVKTVSATSSQSIAAMLSAGPGKHERKQDKTSIWRNSAQTLNAATPVRMNYMKPAITYPPPSRRNAAAEEESKTATVMQTLAGGQYYECNGVSDAGGGGAGSGGGSRSSNYVAKVSI